MADAPKIDGSARFELTFKLPASLLHLNFLTVIAVLTKLYQTVRISIYSLILHPLRSVLSILGIFFGIAAVIWLVALGEGVSYQAQQQIKDLGATNVIIKSVKPSANSSKSGGRNFFLQYGLKREDFRIIKSNLGSDLKQVASIREKFQEFRRDSKTVEGRLVGCTKEYLDLNGLEMFDGRFVDDLDGGDQPENFCVLGGGTANKLFPIQNPIGKTVQIDRDFYKIIGVTQERNPTAAIGGSLDSQDYNKDVYIHLDTFRARIGDMTMTSRTGSSEGEVVELNQITLTVNDIDNVEETAEIVEELLKKNHEVAGDVAVIVPKELLEQAEVTRLMLNFLCIIIAGISLLVGGIGIMNIILASVTERTREIGIRRALGAKRVDIVFQFLVEAVVLTVTGGLLGVLCGYGVGSVVEFCQWIGTEYFAETMANLPPIVTQIEPRIQAWSIWVSLIISVAVGVVFGIIPAIRAALMDPIEALRHE